jgi:23S rRNA pseudouridine2605 synthase
MRLQKFLASAGIASRRASESIITAGRVSVNGHRVTQQGAQVDPAWDRVTVDGVRIQPRRMRYVALHKPRGYLCACRDPQGRPLVTDLLPREWAALYPVGRLDYESEGLLFLTNDGEFCLRLTHPRYGVSKRYVAHVTGRLEVARLGRLTRGVVHAGETLRAERVHLLQSGPTQSRVELELREGKNREVRRLLEAQGLKVVRLQRTQIGPIKLGALPPGKWRVLSTAEIRRLTGGPTPRVPSPLPQH